LILSGWRHIITPIDIKNALDRENIELPAGSIRGDHIAQSIRTMGLMQTPEDFNNLILVENDFRIVRFRDVGYARTDAANRQNILKRNGVPMVSCVIIPNRGANHINIADEVRVRMDK
jgi:multidrug efflux pump